jgi:hypothetical protein
MQRRSNQNQQSRVAIKQENAGGDVENEHTRYFMQIQLSDFSRVKEKL